MEKTFFVLFSFFFTGVSFGQTTPIDNHLTIKFPSEPKIQKFENRTFYSVRKDSSYFIYVSVTDMRGDPNFSIQHDQLSEFYRGVINGALNAANDSKLLSETTIKVGNYEGRDIRYTKDVKGADDVAVLKRILLIDKSLYSFEVWDLSKRGQKNLEKQFFESITVR